MRAVGAVLMLCALGCGSAPPLSPPENVSSADAPPSEECWTPVAHYLGTDEETGLRISRMLRAQGIESVSYGSLGYSVAVPCKHAERARQILRQAILDEGLHAGVKE